MVERLAKLRLGVFSFNSCEGCRHAILANWEELSSRLASMGIEVVHEPLIGLEFSGELDVALVEGSVKKSEVEELERVRYRSRYLVAIGTCSASGYPPMERGGSELIPIDRVVKVDAWVRGCPINIEDLINVLHWVSMGLPPRRARFGWVERRYVTIASRVFELKGDKCIVCGRCIEACRGVGLSILNYAFRGIDTVVSTPFAEPFERHGCIDCSACFYACPVGAIVPRAAPQLGPELYIDVEALALVSAYLGVEPLRAISALRELGAKRVVVWSAASSQRSSNGKIVVPSPAEEEAIARYAPELMPLVANRVEPPSETLVPVCISWLAKSSRVALATWVAKLARTRILDIGVEALEPSEPDDVDVGHLYLSAKRLRVSIPELRKVRGDELVAIYVCPHACSVAALALGMDPSDVDAAREQVLSTLSRYARR